MDQATITWAVYILKLSNGAYYTGISNNVSARLKVHQEGKGSKYVRAHLPFELVYTEPCANKSVALKRELEIKKFSHKQKALLVENKKCQ